jgi:hypothetical protein
MSLIGRGSVDPHLTGFAPAFAVATGVADYVAWLPNNHG